MKIEIPGTVVITAEGMSMADFTFSLETSEFSIPEEDLKTIASLTCMKWAIEHIVREIEILNATREEEQRRWTMPAGKDIH